MKKHSAFSLIELSIVILIIGILIAGITQSSRLVKQARLKTARTLTQSSPVAGIADLLLWYETSLASSFDDAEQSDGTEITTWYDNNPQAISKNNASQSTTGYKPLFKEYVLNGGIPTVRFDGADDYLNFTGTDLIGTSFTIFIVEQRRSGSSENYLLGGSSTMDLSIGYTEGDYPNDVIYFISANNYAGGGIEVPPYSAPITRIHTCRFDKTSGRSQWLNGGNGAENSDSYLTSLSSFNGAAIGRKTDNQSRVLYFNGDLAEVIIFTRALKTEERQAIEDYLGKKYGITIS